MISSNETDEYLSIPQVALVTNEKPSTWRKRVFQRRISFVKCGRNVRIRRSVLDQWLHERTIPACNSEAR
jgi:excisionase family DNA binding protein